MKKNNPFKLLGSWLGFVIAPLLVFTIYKLTYNGCTGIWCFEDMARLGSIIAMILSSILGFFIGWLIEYLITKYKKR